MKFEELVVGQFNDIAVRAAEMIAESPGKHYPLFLIQGPLASGKTQILKTIFENANTTHRTKFVTGNSLLNEYVESIKINRMSDYAKTLEDADLLIIDDLQDLKKRYATQEMLYKVLRARQDNQKQTVIASSKPIHNIEEINQDLEILLMSALVVDIQRPNFEERLLLVKSMAKFSHVELYEDIARLIAERCTENLREIQGSLNKLDASYKILKKDITLAYADEIIYPKEILTKIMAHLETNAESILQKLRDHYQEVVLLSIIEGPVVDTYEFRVQPSQKPINTKAICKEIFHALIGTPVRVVYKDSNNTCLSVEVAKKNRETINLKDSLNSTSFIESNFKLPIVVGIDTKGSSRMVDLTLAPHLLVAGTTGSGKSVFMNSLIQSLINATRPKKIKLLLIDPKQFAFFVFEKMPQLLSPVISSSEKASEALVWTIEEMNKRFTLLKKAGAANFEDYLDLGIENELERIVIVIEEYADLVFSKLGPSVELNILELLDKAHLAGIHVVLATQRPSADIISEGMKAKCNSRIAFRVSTINDSLVILDMPGAEELLGKGDMLFKEGDVITRLHGAYIDENEIEEFVEQFKNGPDYNKSLLKRMNIQHREDGSVSSLNLLADEAASDASMKTDDKYYEAIYAVSTHRVASASFLQRILGIGYNRAASLIEEMEKNHIIAAAIGSKAKEVLIPPPDGVYVALKLEVIKKTPISTIISNYVLLDKRGEELIGICPFHPDTMPALIVNNSKNSYHCSKCGSSGDATLFVMNFKRIQFYEAVNEISKLK